MSRRQLPLPRVPDEAPPPAESPAPVAVFHDSEAFAGAAFIARRVLSVQNDPRPVAGGRARGSAHLSVQGTSGAVRRALDGVTRAAAQVAAEEMVALAKREGRAITVRVRFMLPGHKADCFEVS